MSPSLFAAIDRYIADLLVPPDAALLAAEQSLLDAGMPQIAVSPSQGKLLYVLALLCRARQILEIGTLAGYSAIWMARALPEDGRLTTLEFDPRHAEVARRNLARAGLTDKVEVRVGKALDVLPMLEREGAGPFDLVFIDADKPPYVEYFEWALRMSRPGTLIVADNVIREGQVLEEGSADEKVLGAQRFNRMLAGNPAVEAIIVPMVGLKEFDGMALAVVR